MKFFLFRSLVLCKSEAKMFFCSFARRSKGSQTKGWKIVSRNSLRIDGGFPSGFSIRLSFKVDGCDTEGTFYNYEYLLQVVNRQGGSQK